MGDKSWISYIGQEPDKIREIWLVYEDRDGNVTERKKLDWQPRM